MFLIFLHSNLWLASCAMALSLFVGLENDHEGVMFSSLWVLCFVLGFYNVHGVLSLKKNQLNDIGLRRYYKSKTCRWVTVLGTSGASWLILTASSSLWLPLLCFTFGSLFYDLPIWKRKNKTVVPSVREWPYVKALAVATVMTLVVAVVPSVWSDTTKLSHDISLWGAVWFHLLINTIMGDLRDVRLDRNKGFLTLPVCCGFQRARLLLIGLSFLGAVLMWIFSMGLELSLLFLTDAGLLWFFIGENSKPRRYHLVDLAHWVPLVTLLMVRVVVWMIAWRGI